MANRYGSGQLGASVVARRQAVVDMMRRAGDGLNLKPHVVGRGRHVSAEHHNSSCSSRIAMLTLACCHCYGVWLVSQARVLCTGGDVEVHDGEDGRVYLLDTARVFPPALR